MISHEHSRFSDPDYDPDRLTGLDEYDGPDYAQELRDELRDEEAAMSTATENEEYVRSRWADTAIWDRGKEVPPDLRYEVELVHHPGSFFYFHGETHSVAWSAAYAFTLEREEQIRCIEIEIECLQLTASIAANGSWAEDWQKAFKRILAREQAALAELKKGMRQ